MFNLAYPLKNNLVVLLIDMQETFIPKRDPLIKKLIDQQISVLKYCQRYNVPVINFKITDNQEKKYSKTISDLREDLEKVPCLIERIKEYTSCFNGTDLNEILEKEDVGKIFLMGLNASVCVYDTAKDCLKQGYEIITSPDVIYDMSHISPTDKSIYFYEDKGLVLDSLEDFCNVAEESEIQREKDNRFKQTLSLYNNTFLFI